MKDNLKIFNNFFIIGLSYSSNLLIPLFLIPHFIGNLGIELYGLIILAQSLMAYLTVIIEYHFSTITVKEVSVHRLDSIILNQIFNRAIFLRVFLLIFTLALVVAITIFYPPFKEHPDILLFSSIIIIGQTLLPNWFLLGLEEVKAIAVLNIVFKGIYIILALTFVRKPADAFLPNMFLGLTNIIAGIAGTIYLIRKYHFRIHLPMFKEIKQELNAGYLMTISNISVAIYTSSGPLILALFCSPRIVGEYVAAERILSLFRGVANVYFQATYPRATALMAQGKSYLTKFYKETFPIVIIAVVSGCSVFYFTSDFIVLHVFKIDAPIVATYTRYMLLIIIIIVCNVPYYQRLLMNEPQQANFIIMLGCILSIGLNFLLIPILGPIGCIVSSTLTEAYITISLYIRNIKKQLI